MTHEEQRIEKEIVDLKNMKEREHHAIFRSLDDINKHLFEQDEALKKFNQNFQPILRIFQNATGWNKITIGFLKSLALVGAAIGAIYIIIEFIKKIGK